MGTYVLTRLLQVIPVLFLASIVVFLMIHLIPGDPAVIIGGITASPQELDAIRESKGLNRSIPEQYVIWLGDVVRGDLGESYINGFPVSKLMLGKLPATTWLALGSAIFAMLVAFPLGIVSALKQGSKTDLIGSFFTAIGLGIPAFWLGILLSYFIGLHIGILPPSGYVSPMTDPVNGIKYLILPSITLGLGIAAIMTRFIKSAMLETLNQDYIRTARAKGLRDSMIVFRHALRNAMIPVVTVGGLQIGRLMSGAVVTEAIFSWPGLGKLILDSIMSRDYSVVQGTLLLMVVMFILINLAVDLTYSILDPRIKYGGAV